MLNFALQIEINAMIGGLSSLDKLSGSLGKIQSEVDQLNKSIAAVTRGIMMFGSKIEPAIIKMSELAKAAKDAAFNAKMPDQSHFIGQINQMVTGYERANAALESMIGRQEKLSAVRVGGAAVAPSGKARESESMFGGMGSMAKMFAGLIGIEVGEKLVKGMIESTAHREDVTSSMRMAGYSKQEIDNLTSELKKMRIPGVSVTEGLIGAREIGSVIGRDQTDPGIVRDSMVGARAIAKQTGETDIAQIAKNLVRMADLSYNGTVVNPDGTRSIDKAGFQKQELQLTKLMILGGGNYDSNTMRNNIQQVSQPLRATGKPMDDEMVARLAVLTDAMGPRAGDALNAMNSSMQRGLLASNPLARSILVKAGMVDFHQVHRSFDPSLNNGKGGFVTDRRDILNKDYDPKDQTHFYAVMRERLSKIESPDQVNRDMATVQNKIGGRAEAVLDSEAGQTAQANNLAYLQKMGNSFADFQSQLDTFHDSVKDVGSAMDDLGQTVGRQVLPGFAAFDRGLAGMIRSIDSFLDAHPNVAPTITTGAGILSAVLGVAALPMIFRSIASAGMWVIQSFARIVGVFGEIAMGGARVASALIGLGAAAGIGVGAVTIIAGIIAGLSGLGVALGKLLSMLPESIGGGAKAKAELEYKAAHGGLPSWAKNAQLMDEKKRIEGGTSPFGPQNNPELGVHSPPPKPVEPVPHAVIPTHTSTFPTFAPTFAPNLAPQQPFIPTYASTSNVQFRVHTRDQVGGLPQTYALPPGPSPMGPALPYAPAAAFPPPSGVSAPKKGDLYLNDIYAKSIIVDSKLFAGAMPEKTKAGDTTNYTTAPLLGTPGFQSAAGEPDVGGKAPSVPGVTTSSIPQSVLRTLHAPISDPDLFDGKASPAHKAVLQSISEQNRNERIAAGTATVADMQRETAGHLAGNMMTGDKPTSEEKALLNLGTPGYQSAAGEPDVMSSIAKSPALSTPPSFPPVQGSGARGMRNNNPLNLTFAGQAGATSDGRFAKFPSMQQGIAADARQLLINQDKHGLTTIAGQVSRWAPGNENNTAAYIRSVSKSLNMDPNAPLDLHNPMVMSKMIGAMAQVENGRALDQKLISQGLALNGMTLPPPPDTSSLASKEANSSVTNVPNQNQTHIHDLKVNLDGELLSRHLMERSFDFAPAASSGPTTFDFRAGALPPSSSFRG